MFHKNDLVQALEDTVSRLKKSETCYEWGHMGRCNVGHVLQSLLKIDDHEVVIRSRGAMKEWSKHVEDHQNGCENQLLTCLVEAGLDLERVVHLEGLSEPLVLKNLKGGHRHLTKNDRSDAIEYLSSLTSLLAIVA